MKQTFTLDTSPTSTALCRFREERKNKTEFEETTTCTIMESTSIPPVHNVKEIASIPCESEIMTRHEEEGDQDDEKKQHQQEQNQEEFDFKSFRAKLEQNVDISSTSQIVVNLDDHFKQQKIKKLMDMQKKMEAANFLQSYKNADLTVSKQVNKHISVTPAAAAGNDSVVHHQREKGNYDLSTIDSQQTRKMSESCVDDSSITDDDIHEKGLEEEIIDGTKHLVENNLTDDISNSNHGGIICDSTHDKGLNEELLDVKIDGTKHLVDNELTGDVLSCIPFSENLLVPPKKNYPKMLLSCWCSD